MLHTLFKWELPSYFRGEKKTIVLNSMSSWCAYKIYEMAQKSARPDENLVCTSKNHQNISTIYIDRSKKNSHELISSNPTPFRARTTSSTGQSFIVMLFVHCSKVYENKARQRFRWWKYSLPSNTDFDWLYEPGTQ